MDRVATLLGRGSACGGETDVEVRVHAGEGEVKKGSVKGHC